jgi:hypothetical protein
MTVVSFGNPESEGAVWVGGNTLVSEASLHGVCLVELNSGAKYQDSL